MKLNKQNKQMMITAAVFIALAVVCRLLGIIGFYCYLIGIIRSGIYIFLFAAWGVMLGRRIMQAQLRRYMIGIAGSMTFWFFVRTLKYHFIPTDTLPELVRFAWYCYYISMLLIPMLSLFAALTIGKSEQYRMPVFLRLLCVSTILMVLTVLTNDLHQMVFSFPVEYSVWTDSHYNYGPIYWIIVAWIAINAFLAFAIILRKCRIPHSKKLLWFPLIPFSMTIVYGILCVTVWDAIKLFLGDITAVYCVLIALIFESCIQCGLIQSNTGYGELFKVNKLGAQITDRENNVCLTSSNARQLSKEQIKCAENHTIALDKNTLVKSQKINFGNVLWQVDIKKLNETTEQIEENCRNLAERKRIRQENLETQKKILTLREKNRANDLLHRETARQIDLIDRMLSRYDAETDDNKRRKLLAGTAVLGAYIKRYGNLLLVSQRAKTADIHDLSRCFDDSFVNLELLGVNCLHTMPSELTLQTKDMLYVYRRFEEIVEACLYDLHYVWINVRESKGWIILFMEFVCDTDLSPLASSKSLFTCEDGTYRFTFKLKKGGGQI